MIRTRSAERLTIEERASYVLDLRCSRLQGARLDNANLFKAKLWYADLSSPMDDPINTTRLDDAYLVRANLIRAKLVGVHLNGAKLQRAELGRANLSNARLVNADLWGTAIGGANLTGAILGDGGTSLGKDGESISIRITQRQLDEACADPENPPVLQGIVDAETGEPLVWRGDPVGE